MPNVDDCGMVTVEDAERYFLRLLDKAPTVDAVEVVRCKNCVHYEQFATGIIEQVCVRTDRFCDPNDFCSRGERKDGD